MIDWVEISVDADTVIHLLQKFLSSSGNTLKEVELSMAQILPSK